MRKNQKSAIIISRTHGTNHGGSLYSDALVSTLLEGGWKITLMSESFESLDRIPLRAVKISLQHFFKPGHKKLFGRLKDMLKLFCIATKAPKKIVIVQGDIPRISYVILQCFVNVIFIRQDGILACPANNRFLRVSRTICKKPVGISCLLVDKKEHCFGNLGRIHKMGRIFYRLRDKLLLNCLKNFVSNSQYIAGIHDREAVVIYPPNLSISVIDNPNRSRTKIVFCGRLESVKGAGDAIKILQLLPPTYSLDLIGDGFEKTDLISLTKKTKTEDRVIFHGWLSSVERDRILASSSVALVTSLWDEAFGMVGIEAFSQGTPVVAYNVGGVSEWCKRPAGILVDCGDVISAAEAILELTKTDLKWNEASTAAQRMSASTFSRELFSRSVLDLVYKVSAIEGIQNDN